MKKVIFLLAFFCMLNNIYSQSVGIGTTTPNASAALEIKSNTKGLLIPVMNTAARNAIAAPANGLLVYDSTAKAFYYFKNNGWKSMASINALTDDDGNTTVEVERNTNDDIVRIKTGGSDHTWFMKNSTNAYNLIHYPIDLTDNFLIGTNAGWKLKAGISGNVFMGARAGYSDSTGTNNTLIGNDAGSGIFTGSKNIAIGNNAGLSLKDGSANINIGLNAGRVSTNTTNSVHIGFLSGYYDSLTTNNIGIGNSSLYNNQGNNNIGIGHGSLANTTSDGNLAIGVAALANSTTGFEQIAIGDSAMFNSYNSNPFLATYRNIGIGNKSLFSNTGTQNIAIGSKSLFKNTNGNNNSAIGFDAMENNTMGSFNNAFGVGALRYNISGNSNTAFGYSAAAFNRTGINNVAMGTEALYGNDNGSDNIAIGKQAMFNGASAYYNVAIGTNALYANTSGYANVAIGTAALRTNNIGSNLVAIGDSAMYQNFGGLLNTAVGSKSMFSNLTGSGNTALGFYSLYENKGGFENTANGYGTLVNNNDGDYNTASGSLALRFNVIGSNNTANGSQALYNNNGGQNTATGAHALFSNSAGTGNVAQGFETLFTNTTGTQNIGVGYQAGSNGGSTEFNFNSFCIFIGANANAFSNAGGYNGLLNSIAIGKLASVTANNQVRIGDNLITSIGGYAGWTNFSDGRYKKNVVANVPGLDFITQLQPVTYQLDINGLNKRFNIKPDSTAALESSRQLFIAKKSQQLQTGFIAQDVEAVANKMGFEFSGVDKPENPQDMYGLRYAAFVVPLVKAVQELDANNKNLQLQIDLLKEQNQLLEKKINAFLTTKVL